MNVLSIYYKNTEGGLSSRLHLMLRTLAETNRVWHVCSEPLPFQVAGVNQVVLTCPLSRGWFFWPCFCVRSVLGTFRLAKKHSIDVVVTFGPFYTLLCLAAILFLRIPGVTFVRGDNMKHSNRRLRTGFFFLADLLGLIISTRIVFVSETLRRVYERRYPIVTPKTAVLPNGIRESNSVTEEERVHIRSQLRLDTTHFVMCTTGIFNEGKNFAFLIEAMRHLSGNGTKLIIVGDERGRTGYGNTLRDMVKAFRLEEDVRFCGWQDNPALYAGISDLFVYPSKYEGSPNALLEALSCGVPCLGSDIPEIREVLLHEDLLFPLGETDSFVEKVNRARKDHAFYGHIEKLSKERAKAYSFDWGREACRLLEDEVSNAHVDGRRSS